MPRSLLAVLSFLFTSLVASAVTTGLQDAVWQWSIPDGTTRAYLWIPPHCERVRAVVVANHNMIEQGILESPIMRQTLAQLGIAEVWIVPYFDLVFDFNKGAGTHFDKVIDALAAQSGYEELRFAPVIPLGHSACATYPWNFAAWNPARTLAVLSVHGDAPQTNLTGYGRPNINWGDHNINGVPGLMVMGEYEWWENRLAPAFAFKAKNPDAPIAFLADAGHGHFDYSDRLISFLAMFIRKAVDARLPATAPLDAPVVLKPVNPQDGWLVDRWHRDAPPSAPPAPYALYKGDRTHAFWCFDEEQARATEAYYATSCGKKPQLLSVTSPDQNPLSGCGEPVTPHFIPLANGISFRLNTAFMPTVPGDAKNKNPAVWTQLPVGTPLGHATRGGPITLSVSVGPAVQTGPDTFAIRFGRAEYTANHRNHDIWIIARQAGDDDYKSAVQQAMVHIPENTHGIDQQITFPTIADQLAGTASLKLDASSGAGTPVSYYVLEGPAQIDGDTLTFTPIPPRAKFPVKVTIIAWQWGRSTEPKLKEAPRVERTFYLLAPSGK